jgi:hypothetical protein
VSSTLKKTPLAWIAVWLLAMAVGTMGLVATAQTARAGEGPSVTPTVEPGNPTCKTLLGSAAAYEVKIDPPKSGTYGPVTATFHDNGTQVDFTSTVPVVAVFVKGGNQGGNLYDYSSAPSSGDNNLVTPTGPGGQPQGISHVSFCWNEEPPPTPNALDVSKTATTSYDRKIDWKLEKTVDDNSHSGNAGETAGTSEWTVKATKTATDSNFKVVGDITIKNPNNQPVDFDVYDTLDDGTAAEVDCDPSTKDVKETSGTAPANSSVVCPYTASPTSAASKQNNVLVKSNTEGVPGDTALAPFTWKANVTGDESVTLADPHLNYEKVITETTTFTEPETFDCSNEPIDYKDSKYSYSVKNTASLEGITTNLTANADVNVDCSLAALTASKTANGSYDRTIKWDLSKTVTPQSTFSGKAGDSFNYTWNVGATKSVVEDNYKVTGEITIKNPAAISQTFSVTDELDKPAGTMANVDCNSDLFGDQSSATVPAKSTYVCTYTASTSTATLNTATVKAAGNSDVKATAPVSYTANVMGDEQVTLADPLLSYSKLISGDTAETFPRTFTCPTDPTKYTNYTFTKSITNVATLTGANTKLSKDATVKFTCTYPWRSETATGAGIRYPGTSNWFMYTAYNTSKVDLIAGQNYDSGDIYMTRSGGNTYIKVTLASGFRFANVTQNLKIQNFASAPKSYLQPGAFKYKFSVPQGTSTYTAKIPGETAKFYGIHADVERYVP